MFKQYVAPALVCIVVTIAVWVGLNVTASFFADLRFLHAARIYTEAASRPTK